MGPIGLVGLTQTTTMPCNCQLFQPGGNVPRNDAIPPTAVQRQRQFAWLIEIQFAPALRIAWRSIEARNGRRRLLSCIIGRARLPTLSRPPTPAASRSAASGYRTSPPGAGTLPSRAVGKSVPFECQFCIPTLAVIPRFWSALRPAGTPLPNVRASLRR
jgi:hypothetical protein